MAAAPHRPTILGMETTVHEIATGIYRLSTHLPDVTPAGFTMNQFLVDGEEPLLFHCGLRALFPLRVRSHEATFETMYGIVKRPTHRNTSWDEARFEVCAHRFADLSEPGYGVALLNDGKYGNSARDNVLGISLLRGPLYPDPLADEGDHTFTYSLFPHPGDWTVARVTREAHSLNSPLVVNNGGAQPAGYGLLDTEGVELALGALKPAGDGRGDILRLYEPHGARGDCTLRFAHPVATVRRTNLLEEPEGAVEISDGAVRLTIRPFEVVTLLIDWERDKDARES